MQDKAVNTIQMAIRAGKAIRGEGLIPSIINGSSKVVVYSSQIGNNSKKRFSISRKRLVFLPSSLIIFASI